MHANDVPVCAVCDRHADPAHGVTFLRDAYTYGDPYDACHTAPVAQARPPIQEIYRGHVILVSGGRAEFAVTWEGEHVDSGPTIGVGLEAILDAIKNDIDIMIEDMIAMYEKELARLTEEGSIVQADEMLAEILSLRDAESRDDEIPF